MKKILMLLVLVTSFTLAFAQSGNGERKNVQTTDKYQVVTNPFWSNWFFSLGGGAQVLYGQADNAADFDDRISPTLNFALGKWFTPGLGLRMQYSGLKAKGYTYRAGTDYAGSELLNGGYYKQAWNYMNLHGDVLFNLNALFGGYNPDRIYEIIPYIGAGFTHSYKTPKRESATLNVGIINRFRLCSVLDLHLELSAVGLESKFDGEHKSKHDYDGILAATMGLTYNFPVRGFKHPAPQLITEQELSDMRNRMNQLTADNERLQRELADARNKPAVVEQKEVAVDNGDIATRTVFFELNSTKLTPENEMNLSYLADKMKQSPNATYTVYGYADSATGTAEYNKSISEKRAKAVVDVLVNKYGIDANRLKIGAGGGVDKFGKPNFLNRVVLVENSDK